MSAREPDLATPRPLEPAALVVLVRELGLFRALAVGLEVGARMAAGEPFSRLGPPATPKERAARAQIAPAIVLFAVLRRVRGRDALRITREVVLAAGAAFMGRVVGPLAQATSLDEVSLARTTSRFPNAKFSGFEVSADRVAFTARDCLFPSLTREAGAPELAPFFCEVDAKAFQDLNVRLDRPRTIATGASDCHFQLIRIRPRG
ncbi:MAG: L-2-amino-thiazoline-4-carboxylic acid hydrolase [Polyangiaceae bacterium]